MDTRLMLAWLHLLALAAGLAGVWARARAMRDTLRDPEDRGALRRALVGDAWWVIAAALWLTTGLWRLIGSTEKSTSWYFGNQTFLLKMALFLAIVGLEVWPVMTLARWRAKKAEPHPRDVGRIEVISYVQCALVIAVVLAAAGMARGYGATPGEEARVADADGAVDDSAGYPAMKPSGTETVTADDLALLAREIGMPLDDLDPSALRSSFTDRRGGGTRQHNALDLMAPRRTPVRSAATGRVLKLFTSVAGGLMLYAADSAERFILMYAHLDGYAPGIRDGSLIVKGQEIGYVGSTGNASPSAPHLHFAIARSADVKRWSKGQPIDPVPVLVAGAKRP